MGRFFAICLFVLAGAYSVDLRAETSESFTQWSESVKLACGRMSNAHNRILCFHENTVEKSKEDGSLVLHSVDFVCGGLDRLQEQCYVKAFEFVKKNPPPWIHEDYPQNLSDFALSVCKELRPEPRELKYNPKKDASAAKAEQAEFGYNRLQCFAKVSDMSPEINKVFANHHCQRNSEWNSDCHESSLVQYLAELNDLKKTMAHNQPPLGKTN